MKKHLSIILSSFALVGVITLAMVILFDKISLSNISLESFIGIIATLIGVLVTFAVAWQIINAMEIKNKLAEIDGLKNKVEEQNKTIEELSHKTRHLFALTIATEILENDEAEEAFRYCLTSLVSTMKLKNPINIDITLDLLEKCTQNFKDNHRIEKEFYKETIGLDKEIRILHNYDFARSRYESLIKTYIEDVKYK